MKRHVPGSRTLAIAVLGIFASLAYVTAGAAQDKPVFVDGVRIYSKLPATPLDHIDPNSIETLKVLKGPSAVERYGADAASGVIVVATKQGVKGEHAPIVIVDGVRVYSEPPKTPLDYIDLNSVETMEVLKDSSAAERYGADAAGGVVVVTTKKKQP